jgi:hypothetical protein
MWLASLVCKGNLPAEIGRVGISWLSTLQLYLKDDCSQAIGTQIKNAGPLLIGNQPSNPKVLRVVLDNF